MTSTITPPAPVMAISTAKNNAELIVQAAQLGYLQGHVIDVTFGKGAFWTLHQPDRFTAHGLDVDGAGHYDDGVDFRRLPYSDGAVDTVVLDPPYKLNGTGGSHPSDKSYGVAAAGVRWQDRMQLCRDGITEAARVVRCCGMVLVKCMDQVCSGDVRWQTIDFTNHAATVGLRLVDMLHLPSYRAQPEGRSQQHARRNYSTLLVFERVAGPRSGFDELETPA